MKMDWEVDVAAIRQAAQDSAGHKKEINVWSPTTGLMGGVMWGMVLQCDWDADDQGSTISVFATPENIPSGALYRCTYSLECVGVQVEAVELRDETDIFAHAQYWGSVDLFMLGPMSGGFDEAAWAAKGLPTIGSIRLRLTVKDAN
jgi:hypothetical protein